MKINDILNELMSSPIGGSINSDACIQNGDNVELHFWNGERYMLTLKKLSNGCAYDAQTGDVAKPHKEYKIVNGTSYDVRTPQRVIDILERSRINKLRIQLFYGEPGKVWESARPERGYIGRSTGNSKIPLLIRTARSLGGEAVLDHCIVRIIEAKTKKVLYDASVKG